MRPLHRCAFCLLDAKQGAGSCDVVPEKEQRDARGQLVAGRLTTVNHRFYNRPMLFSGEPRRRSVALFAAGTFVFLALLIALNAFNTSNIRFLNPETSGEILAFTGLTVLVFLLLMTLLVALFRNILKLYAGQSSTVLGARLRTRMVLGAALIALTPAVFMFLFSFTLMNRSIDRWFSPEDNGVARGLGAGGAATRAICHQQRHGRSRVDCGFRRCGPGCAGAARCAKCTPHHAGRRLCACLRQGRTGHRSLSGSARFRRCQSRALAGRG